MELILAMIVMGACAFIFIRSNKGTQREVKLEPDGESRAFALYYVASEMQFARDEMPIQVLALAAGRMNGHIEFSMSGALSNYVLHAHGRNVAHGELSRAVLATVSFLQAELQALNNPLAAKRLIRRMHDSDTPIAITEVELERQYAELQADLARDERVGRRLQNALLRDRAGELFEAHHRTTISVYVEAVIQTAELSMATKQI